MIKHLQLPSIKKIETIVQKNLGYISFAQGALRVGGVPLQARQYIQKILETDVADYYGPAAGLYSLRKQLADSYRSVFSSITPEHILISHGSIGAFAVLCGALLKSGDAVLLPTPTYPVYHNVILSVGGTPIHAPIYNFIHGTWTFNIDALQNYVTPETKMLVLSNPSNPLGLLLDTKTIEQLITFSKEHNLYLVIDEAYDSFIFNTKKTDIMPYLEKNPHCIRLGSFSKNGAMSGWRIGYLIAQPELIEQLIPIQDGLLCCPSMIGQKLAEYIHAHQDLMQPSQEKVLWAKNRVVQFFTHYQKKGLVDFQEPDGGFYLFFKQNIIPEEIFVDQLLTKHGVGLVHGTDFSKHTAAWSRLCFAREPEIIIEGLKRIELCFEQTLNNKKTSHTIESISHV
jgi:aminotransferase